MVSARLRSLEQNNFSDLLSICFIFQNRKEPPEIQREIYMNTDLEQAERQQKWTISMSEVSQEKNQMF